MMSLFRTPNTLTTTIKDRLQPLVQLNDKDADSSGDSSSQQLNCIKCQSPFSELTLDNGSKVWNSISCSFCSSWVCLSCAAPGHTTKAAKSVAMSILGMGSIIFHCGRSECIRPDVQALQKQVNDLSKTVAGLLANANAPSPPPPVEGHFDPQLIEDMVENVVRRLQGQLIESASMAATKAAIAAVQETLEKKEKRSNLVIVGWPEHANSDQDQNVVDTEKLTDYCTEMNIDSNAIAKNFRDGSSFKKPRIMKVVFADSGARRSFLTGAGSLMKKDPDFRGMRYIPFVRPDMTFREREEDKALRQELWEMKARTGQDLIIRGGKIITRPASRSPSPT